jgi:homoserine kinase
MPHAVTAAAPASIGNVAVGFDALGCAVHGKHDRVRVRRVEAAGVHLDHVHGADLPLQPEANTATAGLSAFLDDHDVPHGLRVTIDKGIPLSAGLGGSAASAVAGIWAADACCGTGLSDEAKMRYALQGEAVASGTPHGDNVAASLCGGLVLTRGVDPPRLTHLPVPEAIRCVLVHPDLQVETEAARGVVPEDVPLSAAVAQSARLAGFVAACYEGDLDAIRDTLRDDLVEPHRAALVPGFRDVQAAAQEAGALGCSFSGAGPTMFAWCAGDEAAKRACAAMTAAGEAAGHSIESWVSPVNAQGAHVVSAAEREAADEAEER